MKLVQYAPISYFVNSLLVNIIKAITKSKCGVMFTTE